MYQQLLARGIRPLWVIQAAPCWAQGKQCRQGSDPSEDHYDEFAAFAAQAAQRYPEALGIEIWNEPNYDIYWGGDADPKSYGRMVAAVVPAVKAANPAMPVVTAGLSPHINSEKDAMAYKKFLRRAYATGGPQLADAIGAHPYPNRLYSQDYLGNVRTHLFRYQGVMGQNGDGDKPIWVTETGISTAGKEAFTEEHQAEALARIYTQFRRIANVPVVVFHRFVDQPDSPRDGERGYGVLNGGGGPKAAIAPSHRLAERAADGRARSQRPLTARGARRRRPGAHPHPRPLGLGARRQRERPQVLRQATREVAQERASQSGPRAAERLELPAEGRQEGDVVQVAGEGRLPRRDPLRVCREGALHGRARSAGRSTRATTSTSR